MIDTKGNDATAGIRHIRIRMANERAFFAWIRTNIWIMAFDFVVERY